MTLSKLIVGGFKSLRDIVEIPLAPITLLFGPNSAGKSVIREALFELGKRTSLENSASELTTLLRAYSNHGDSHGHIIPNEDDPENPEILGITLGCEIDIFSHDTSAEMAAENAWTDLGRDLYWALNERSVRFLFVDQGVGLTAAHEMSTDNELLFEHRNYISEEERDSLPTLISDPGNFGVKTEKIGLLTLNLENEVFASPKFQRLCKRLLDVSADLPADWANRIIWKEGAHLYVRVNTWQMQCENWLDPYVSSLNRKFVEKLAPLSEPLGALCFAINELNRQFRHALGIELQMTHVSGSRSLLTETDVTTEWTEVHDGYGGHHAYSSFADYVTWLGKRSLGEAELDLPLSILSHDRDDFVNDILNGSLFGSQRYRINTKVRFREERELTPEPSDPKYFMKCSPYLRDSQGRTLGFEQVGSGISYVFPVLAALWGADRSLIEQPELHLHPAAQCEMGDAIVRAFNRGRFSIIETHSEHLLLRMLRRIRETSEARIEDRELQCQPEAVAVLYFQPQEDGSTKVHQLRVSRSGDFKDLWPNGFFEERARELFDE